VPTAAAIITRAVISSVLGNLIAAADRRVIGAVIVAAAAFPAATMASTPIIVLAVVPTLAATTTIIAGAIIGAFLCQGRGHREGCGGRIKGDWGCGETEGNGTEQSCCKDLGHRGLPCCEATACVTDHRLFRHSPGM
jgi:hypothetical protein